MRDSQLLGPWGEAVAARYLRRHGYTIEAANYRCRLGELDIIAQDRHYTAFVEVKLRRSAAFAQAREFVTAAKQQRLRATAQLWLSENPGAKQPRFDVIEVYAPEGIDSREIRIQHLENAFM